ncbi:Protein of unknown function [Pyronema omphalodes CBS 100304]|uniref:Uncharacterized protein n=1 Tax=Pyronema omphalodes (strain CBS 100304) TaxID=1076935 RepID=U4LHR8_PYROM|nr:Protein of unknown function [Pyronema omphalodes CBS 100304]
MQISRVFLLALNQREGKSVPCNHQHANLHRAYVSLAVGCAPPLLNEIFNRARVLQAVLAEIRCWWRERRWQCSMVRMDINRREIENLISELPHHTRAFYYSGRFSPRVFDLRRKKIRQNQKQKLHISRLVRGSASRVENDVVKAVDSLAAFRLHNQIHVDICFEIFCSTPHPYHMQVLPTVCPCLRGCRRGPRCNPPESHQSFEPGPAQPLDILRWLAGYLRGWLVLMEESAFFMAAARRPRASTVMQRTFPLLSIRTSHLGSLDNRC